MQLVKRYLMPETEGEKPTKSRLFNLLELSLVASFFPFGVKFS